MTKSTPQAQGQATPEGATELSEYRSQKLHEALLEIERVTAQRDELLEALQSVERVLSTYSDKIESWQWHMLKSVRSAVAKAEAK